MSTAGCAHFRAVPGRALAISLAEHPATAAQSAG
jgi:hypothetical protein